MIIKNKDVIEMSKMMHIDLTIDETKHIEKEVNEITSRLEKMLETDTEGYDNFINFTQNKNIFADYSQQEEINYQALTSSLNNFDGQFVKIIKEPIHE